MPTSRATLIEEVTERVRLTPTRDEDLETLNGTHKLILPQNKESGKAMSKLRSVKKLEPGSCLDLTCGSAEHTCDGRSCVRMQSFQREDLVAWFGYVTQRERERDTNTIVNIATALGFFSKMCSLQSLEMVESEHHLAWSVANNSEVHQRVEDRS